MFIKLTQLTGESIYFPKNIVFYSRPQSGQEGPPNEIITLVVYHNIKYIVQESPEEILVMIDDKGPPEQPEEGRMKYHILDYKDEKRASFVFKADRNYSLKMMKRAYAENEPVFIKAQDDK